MIKAPTNLFNTIKAFPQKSVYTPLNLYIPQFNCLNFFPKYTALNEPVVEIKKNSKEKSIEKGKDKKKFIFKNKKRGRMNKTSDNNLHENVHNKYSNDNVKRKIKTKFHSYLIYLLNYLMKKISKDSQKRFLKINSEMTKNIGIEYNKKLMDKTLKEIVLDVSKKYPDKYHNKECLQYILSQNNNEEIVKVLNMTYKELYTDYYLKSTKKDFDNLPGNESFEEHKERLNEMYGQQYLDKFLENSKKFIDFFMNGKKRKSRKQKELENASNSENEQFDTNTNSFEAINCENSENNCNKKIMVSIGTQTEIENIHTKIITFA